MAESLKEYTGKNLLKPADGLEPYIPDDSLVQAVAYARALGRPLLLKGEPGCGKTLLAKAVAHELFGNNYKTYYFSWPVKSTSKAADGLYIFDHIARLRDAQLTRFRKTEPEEDHKKETEEERSRKEREQNKNYRKFGALGEAFRVAVQEKIASVVLIDEIDKADIDFPNDLLHELDEMHFAIPETGESFAVERQCRPFIVITSNDEKELPVAFLRRCVFHYIEFPDEKILAKIVKANFNKLPEKLLKIAVERFRSIRQRMEQEGITDKKISTSELKDWVNIIEYQLVNGLVKEEDIIAELGEESSLPFFQVLLKTVNDQKQFIPTRNT